MYYRCNRITNHRINLSLSPSYLSLTNYLKYHSITLIIYSNRLFRFNSSHLEPQKAIFFSKITHRPFNLEDWYYPIAFGDRATAFWNGNVWYPSPSVFRGSSQGTFVQEAHGKRQRVAPTPHINV